MLFYDKAFQNGHRTCLRSSTENRYKSQYHEVRSYASSRSFSKACEAFQAIQSFVLPPTVWEWLQMYVIHCAYLYRYRFSQNCLYPIGNRLSSIPSITQKAFYFCQLFFILLKSEQRPFLSLLLAAVMARACGNPCVSTAMCRFIPDIFLPASYPFPI